MTVDEPLVDLTRPIHLIVPHLHLDVSRPRLLIRLPSHPPLKHLTRSRNVPEELLKVDVFVPDLVDAREESDGSVEEVTGVRDVARFEFLRSGRRGVRGRWEGGRGKERRTISV